MDFLKERGLRVPEDISWCPLTIRGGAGSRTEILSAIHPKYNLGRITARNLLRMMEDPDWQKKELRAPVSGGIQQWKLGS